MFIFRLFKKYLDRNVQKKPADATHTCCVPPMGKYARFTDVQKQIIRKQYAWMLEFNKHASKGRRVTAKDLAEDLNKVFNADKDTHAYARIWNRNDVGANK